MGNNPTKQQCIVPQKGYRVISISRPDVTQQLEDILTDYIISPDPKKIDYRRESVRFQVYSILDQQIRTVQIPVKNRQLGFQLKLVTINSAILRITKIFPSSPLQKHRVQTNQFIVGVLQGHFSCIKTFAQLIKNITLLASKSHITMGICNKEGKVRLIKIEVIQLKQWHTKGHGLLGCQLAQGWIHKYKPIRSHQSIMLQQPAQGQHPTSLKSIPITQQTQASDRIDLKNEHSMPIQFSLEHQSEDDQIIDSKCEMVNNKYDRNGILEYKFRGNYKQQQIVDAAIVCRCRPINLQCQKCFIQKEGSFHFYNKKSKRIICLPINFMMPIEPIT